MFTLVTSGLSSSECGMSSLACMIAVLNVWYWLKLHVGSKCQGQDGHSVRIATQKAELWRGKNLKLISWVIWIKRVITIMWSPIWTQLQSPLCDSYDVIWWHGFSDESFNTSQRPSLLAPLAGACQSLSVQTTQSWAVAYLGIQQSVYKVHNYTWIMTRVTR